MKTVYFAHPNTEDSKLIAELKEAIEAKGFNIIEPISANPFDQQLKGRGITSKKLRNRRFAINLANWCLKKIDECDLLIAWIPSNLNQILIGTPMEILYAYQKGKPIYILTDGPIAFHPFLQKFATKTFRHLYELQAELGHVHEQTQTVERNGHPRFYELLKEIAELHNRKNADYSKKGDPLSNFHMCEAFGIPAWKGCLVRMSDKWSRLVQLANKPAPAVRDEAITDTMTDLAVYALLCRILWEEAMKK